jgi:1,4-alpha-glucan branching enzyme
VTFELPKEVEAQTAAVCGDFNEWSPTGHPMTRRKDGRLSVTIAMPAARSYRYRYLLDGERWENDWAADGYVQNEFGGDDSLLEL